MLDPLMVRLIAPPINRAGTFLAARGISANTMTVGGFVIGMCAVPALAFHHYGAALGFILANRVADGVDGAIARATEKTDFGAYLDIVLDFIFYAAIVFGFALANPADALVAGALLVSFMGTGASFLGYAVIAAKLRLETEARGTKSFFYSGGLAEGTETILFFVLICIWPALFVPASLTFMVLCWLTVCMRIAQAHHTFKDTRS